jgi:hypothetical protein
MDGRSTPLKVEQFFVVLSRLDRNDGVVIEMGPEVPSQIARRVRALGELRGKTVCITLPLILRGYTDAVFDELVERSGPDASLVVRCDATLLATHAAQESGAAKLCEWTTAPAPRSQGQSRDDRRRRRGSARIYDDMHLASVCSGEC